MWGLWREGNIWKDEKSERGLFFLGLVECLCRKFSCCSRSACLHINERWFVMEMQYCVSQLDFAWEGRKRIVRSK